MVRKLAKNTASVIPTFISHSGSSNANVNGFAKSIVLGPAAGAADAAGGRVDMKRGILVDHVATGRIALPRFARRVSVASWPQAARIFRPRVWRTKAKKPFR